MKSLLSLILFFVFCHSTATAQKRPFTPSFTALRVSNMDSSIQWYNSVLGLKLRNRVDNAERGFKQSILISETVMIELVELVKGISPDSVLAHYPNGSTFHGINKFGFTVPAIEELFQQFLTKGIKMHGKMVTDPVNNKKTFLVTDPDGNLIQFFEQ